MPIQTELTELIKILRMASADNHVSGELGKAWKERYKLYHTLNKNPVPDSVKKFDDFVHSDKSALDDLNIFDGKLPDLDSKTL